MLHRDLAAVPFLVTCVCLCGVVLSCTTDCSPGFKCVQVDIPGIPIPLEYCEPDNTPTTDNDSTTVSANDSTTVSANDSTTVSANNSTSVSANESTTVFAKNSTTVSANDSTTVSASGSASDSTTVSVTDSTTSIYPKSYNACEPGFQFRPITERMCTPDGILCVYGQCRSESRGQYCVCDPGTDMTSQRCNKDVCCKYCGDHGHCYKTSNGTETCRCDNEYINADDGDYCVYDYGPTAPPPETATWYWWVVGGCILALVLLLVALAVILRVMWKRRVVLVMKFVHHFQGYEDDDDREWDAFISYKGNTPDEDFVVRTLFPKLEREMGFKVHVHFKDFVPGETITNGIINAVEKSRRTIMVVSPHYLTSSFTKFEWQMAQQKMLERKHKIIPILLEDISEQKDTMDANLKTILDSVTYIEWPKSGTQKQVDKFWKRIELSMPKKKNRTSDSSRTPNSYNVTSGHQNGGFHDVTNPDSVKITIDGNSNRRTVEQLSTSCDYNTLDEMKMMGPEEVYDTLNELEMESRDQKVESHDQNDTTDVDSPRYVKLEPTLDQKIETLEAPKLEPKPEVNSTKSTENNDKKQHEYLNILRIDL